MLIWALIVGMTAVAVSIVLVPVLRRRPEAAIAAEAGEVSVYRDQLAEIDRDLESGLVGPAEAEAARAEIGRRILRVGRRTADTAAGGGRSRFVPLVAALFVPLLAVGLYAKLGHPSLPDMPLSGRAAEASADKSLEAMIAKVVKHLAEHPDDTKGWDVLAPTYMHLGRFDLAAAAWRNAIRTGGPDERRLTELGRALTAAADDVITPEARAAFEQAITVEPGAILPRFFLAAGLSQDGRKQEAVDAWKAIVARGTGNEGWLPEARRALAEAEAELAGKPTEPPAGSAPPAAAAPQAPGPSASDIEAAAQMSPEDRAKMIREMVTRLQERLMSAGGTVEQWERLIRSQLMIGQTADAEAALAKARADFAGDAAALARLDALTTGPKP